MEAARRVFELARPDTPIDINQLIGQAGDPLRFCYLLASMIGLDVAKEQAILEANQLEQVQQLLLDSLAHEAQILELRNQITSRAQTEMSKEQRDYLLRQQLRAIQEELGEKDPRER